MDPVGHDASGFPAEHATPVYTNLRCAVLPVSGTERDEFEQSGIQITHRVYFPTFHGTMEMPDIREHDLVYFPSGSSAQRVLMLTARINENEQGILLSMMAVERQTQSPP